MSFWVVLRDGARCVTCGRTNNLTASHLFKRGNENARWLPLNLFCQCAPCNHRHNHDPYPLEAVFRRRHGQAMMDELYRTWQGASHFKQHHLAEMLEGRIGWLLDSFAKSDRTFDEVDAARMKMR